MRRPAIYTTAALLSISMSLPLGQTANAAETCGAYDVTLTGTPGQELVGTEDKDVVLTNGATKVTTLGGDDIVCSPGHGTIIDTGDGDDIAYTGEKNKPNSDQISLGVGADTVVWKGIQTDEGSLDGGEDGVVQGQPAGDNLSMFLDGKLTFDNRIGSATRNSEPYLDWTGIEDFYAGKSIGLDESVPQPGHSVTFVGSDLDEELMLWRPAGLVTVDMGGGDDEFSTMQTPRFGSRVTGGPGHDRFWIAEPVKPLRVDLSAGRLDTARTPSAKTKMSMPGFEDANVRSDWAMVIGNSQDNTITTWACQQTVRGRGGDDRITRTKYWNLWKPTKRSCLRQSILDGGPGDDTLVGNEGADHLIGGPGRDEADGGGGKDVCSAEVRRRCKG